MKRKLFFTLVLSFSIVGGLLTGCGSKDSVSAGKKADAGSEKDLEVIKVGASITPHAEILRSVSDELEKQGYKLEVVEYNDYIIPNTALESGELDANYIQHLPYLEDFNKENGTHIVSAADVHYEPFGIYAGKSDSLENLKEGAVIAVPNDTTNEARALLLLQDQGLIKLKENAGLTATVKDIADNPKKFEIKELEAAQVPKALQDVDVAAINTNYALEANLKLSDALASEGADSLAAKTYANIIAVKEGNENAEKIKALIDAVKTDKVKKFIEDQYEGAVVPTF